MTLRCGEWPGGCYTRVYDVQSIHYTRTGENKAHGNKIPTNTPLAKPCALEKGYLLSVCSGTLWARGGLTNIGHSPGQKPRSRPEYLLPPMAPDI